MEGFLSKHGSMFNAGNTKTVAIDFYPLKDNFSALVFPASKEAIKSFPTEDSADSFASKGREMGREMGPALGNSNLTPGGKSKPSVNREGKISINTNRKRSYSSVSASA